MMISMANIYCPEEALVISQNRNAVMFYSWHCIVLPFG